jgi:hypothetical protein
MIDIDPATGAPITASSTNQPGSPNVNPDLSQAISGIGPSEGREPPSFIAGNLNPTNEPASQDNSARDKDKDPLLGTGTVAARPSAQDAATSGISGDSQQNMRAVDATGGTLVKDGSVSDHTSERINPTDLKKTADVMNDQGLVGRRDPSREGGLIDGEVMTEFKTRHEAMIAGQHMTETVRVPLDMQKDKAVVLAHIQLVLRDGGMDSASQIKALERIAQVLNMSDVSDLNSPAQQEVDKEDNPAFQANVNKEKK